MQSTENIWNDQNLVKILAQGGIAVIPTDTVYGIVGRAEDALVVESIYQARKRTPEKPCIVLIGEINELKKFSITMSTEQEKVIDKKKSYLSSFLSSILIALVTNGNISL